MRALVFCASTLGPAAVAAAVPQYHLQPLGTLGGSYLEPDSINNVGEVAGWGATANGGRHAFYLPAGGNVPQQITSGPDAFAHEINDAGVIVGEQDGRAFRWVGGTYSDIGLGFGTAINNGGDIVGYNNGIAFRWRNGVRESLGVPFGYLYSHPRDINNNGLVLANITSTSGNRFIGTWQDGTGWTVWDELNTGEVRAINDLGQAVGYDQNNRGFLWQNGNLLDLGTLHDFDYGQGYDVNNAGQVVGTTYNLAPPGGRAAFIWENGVMYDLEALLDASGNGYQLGTAWSINDGGQIVATGTDPVGLARAVLLTPIPEPAWASLSVTGVLLLRRRRRAAVAARR
jgi:probable HAF family extracellular repeat protein